MKIIADTNIFLAVVLEEPEKAQIIHLTIGHELVAPAVLPFEIGNALTAMMKKRSISEARQKLSQVLDVARTEEVIIKRRGGETFTLALQESSESPFDVPGIKTKATTQDIIDAVTESRAGR